jgi:hypothetical protein
LSFVTASVDQINIGMKALGDTIKEAMQPVQNLAKAA